MKKLLTLLIVVGFATTAFGQGIKNSAHDFSGDNWNGTGEICIVCHTPHNALVDVPLWNHAQTAVTTFTPYASSTMGATAGQPNGNSLLCLSCHDGTVGLEDFGGAGGNTYITGDDLVGTDLSNDHPISITFDAALASSDGGLFDPTTTNSGLGGTITVDLLDSNQVQCSSCHDVHDASGNSKLLVISNAASALCLTCHDK